MAPRVRRHANPFNCTRLVGALDREAFFGRAGPLEVELGCGSGSFLLARALANPDCDFVGFEVRRPLVEAVMARPDRPSNLVIFHANANINLKVADPGVIRRFHIHFPDPWVKKKHWKRRMLQPSVVRAMAELLPVGGDIYAQTDVLGLADEMFAFFGAEQALVSRLDASMRVPKPIEEQTHWELHHEKAGEPIFRMLFEKVREPCGAIPELALGPTGALDAAVQMQSESESEPEASI